MGKEYNTGVDPTLYAATPPLEALKLLLGHAASDTTKNLHIMLSDVKRAYFHALAKRELYVELPPEDAGYQAGWVGRFRLALYGTRDAPARWEAFLAAELQKHGFEVSTASWCAPRRVKPRLDLTSTSVRLSAINIRISHSRVARTCAHLR